MNMTLETPFLKGYERIARNYISIIRSIYKYNCFADYSTPGAIESAYNDYSEEVREFTQNEEVRKMFLGDNEAAESSLIWQEVLSNLFDISRGDKLDFYIYSLLSPFAQVLTAFENEKTDEDKYVSKWLMQTGTFGDPEIVAQLLDDISDFDNVPLIDNVPVVAVTFISRLIEACNLLGYDVFEIANKFHIPIPEAISRFNVEKAVFKSKYEVARYFPYFDRRKFLKCNPMNKEQYLPSELDTTRAREYFGKAQEAGFIAKTDTGFKWTMTAGRGALAQLAYFCGRVYCPSNVERLPETALNRLFGVSRIGSALTQVNNASPQKWRQRIDSMFED